jgi:hypothetical protein
MTLTGKGMEGLLARKLNISAVTIQVNLALG